MPADITPATPGDASEPGSPDDGSPHPPGVTSPRSNATCASISGPNRTSSNPAEWCGDVHRIHRGITTAAGVHAGPVLGRGERLMIGPRVDYAEVFRDLPVPVL